MTVTYCTSTHSALATIQNPPLLSEETEVCYRKIRGRGFVYQKYAKRFTYHWFIYTLLSIQTNKRSSAAGCP